MKKWFNNWEWLKCSGEQWNYARITSLMLFVSNTVFLAWKIGIKGFSEPELSWRHAVIYCSAYLTGLVLFGLEVWRENKKISVKVGDKEYGINLGK